MRASAIIFIIWVLVFTGCASKHRPPDLGAIYNRAAAYHGEERNPVILIPGVVGSRLIDSQSGQVVWGAFAGGYADPERPEGARLAALPMRKGVSLRELRDGVVPDGALDRLRVVLFGLPIEMSAYYHILRTLGIGGYRDELLGMSGAIDYGGDHFTCFQFDYDWRRDNVEGAKRLHEFILEKRAYVQKELEKRFGIANYDVKFNIVAHSMGGLIARYYLRYGPTDLPDDGSLPPVTWAGARYVERAVLVGPPNAGSVKSLIQLVHGRKLGPFLPKYEPAILGTMPAIYQLLPRGRHGAIVDDADPQVRIDHILSPEFWEEMEWGLAAPDQDRVLQWLLPNTENPKDRRRIALDHQRKCLERARQFTTALDMPASPPKGLSLSLIAGDASSTPVVVSLNRSNGDLKVIERGPGDGIVLRTSALMDERVSGDWSPTLVSPIAWKQVLFLFSGHLQMTRDPVFTDNLLFLLLEEPGRKS
jgi:hypothetical protein